MPKRTVNWASSEKEPTVSTRTTTLCTLWRPCHARTTNHGTDPAPCASTINVCKKWTVTTVRSQLTIPEASPEVAFVPLWPPNVVLSHLAGCQLELLLGSRGTERNLSRKQDLHTHRERMMQQPFREESRVEVEWCVGACTRPREALCSSRHNLAFDRERVTVMPHARMTHNVVDMFHEGTKENSCEMLRIHRERPPRAAFTTSGSFFIPSMRRRNARANLRHKEPAELHEALNVRNPCWQEGPSNLSMTGKQANTVEPESL